MAVNGLVNGNDRLVPLKRASLALRVSRTRLARARTRSGYESPFIAQHHVDKRPTRRGDIGDAGRVEGAGATPLPGISRTLSRASSTTISRMPSWFTSLK